MKTYYKLALLPGILFAFLFYSCETEGGQEIREVHKPELNIEITGLTKTGTTGDIPMYEAENLGDQFTVKINARSNKKSGEVLKEFMAYRGLKNNEGEGNKSIGENAYSADTILRDLWIKEFNFDFKETAGFIRKGTASDTTKRYFRHIISIIDNNDERKDYMFDITIKNPPRSDTCTYIKSTVALGAQQSRVYGHFYSCKAFRTYMWDATTTNRFVNGSINGSSADNQKRELDIVYCWTENGATLACPVETSITDLEFNGRGSNQNELNKNHYLNTWGATRQTTKFKMTPDLDFENITDERSLRDAIRANINTTSGSSNKVGNLAAGDIIGFQMNTQTTLYNKKYKVKGFIRILEIVEGERGWINLEIRSAFVPDPITGWILD